jgi:hypothetical protein
MRTLLGVLILEDLPWSGTLKRVSALTRYLYSEISRALFIYYTTFMRALSFQRDQLWAIIISCTGSRLCFPAMFRALDLGILDARFILGFNDSGDTTLLDALAYRIEVDAVLSTGGQRCWLESRPC